MTEHVTQTRQSNPPFRLVLWTMMRRQPGRYVLALVIWVTIWTM